MNPDNLSGQLPMLWGDDLMLRECYFHLGEIQDALLFGLLRREWAARRQFQHSANTVLK